LKCGDTVGFTRSVDTSGRCVIAVKKNGATIKTISTHTWGAQTTNGCGSGYMWVGHYNNPTRQCFRNVVFTQTRVW